MKNKIILLAIGMVIASVTLAWTMAPFQQALKDMKSDAKLAHAKAIDTSSLADRIRKVSLELKNLSEATNYKDQRKKIKQVVEQSNLLVRLVDDLALQAKDMKKRSLNIQGASRKVAKLSTGGKAVPGKHCGKGEVWVPRQKNPNGVWVPGHCARTY